MAKHSIKSTYSAGAVVLLGALAPQTFAQTSSITASGQGITPGAAVPAPVASALPSTTRPMTDVSFRDIEVTEVLNMISQGFNVPMVIAPDVNGIILPAINLPNQTPEAAIQAIAVAAGLKYRRQADGTYLIAKTLPEDQSVGSVNGSITQSGGSGFGNSMGAMPSPVLPGFGNENNRFEAANNGMFEMPQLVENNARSQRKRMQQIRVRNVSPSLMAYWINPADHPMPVQLQSSATNQRNYGPRPIARPALSSEDQQALRNDLSANFNQGVNPGNFNPYTQQRDNAEYRSNAQFGGGGGGGGGGRNGNQNGGGGGNQRGGNRGGAAGGGGAGGGVFDLPEGVDRIVAVDPQNALLVFGTDEGVRELTDTIQFLDRPLRQVEIEAQFVSVNTGDTNNFGINYTTSQGNFNANAGNFAPTPPGNAGSLQVGFVRGNFQATLSALVSKNRAKVITAPRVTAINNLTASLFQTSRTPFILTTVSQNGGLGGGQLAAQTAFFIETQIGLIVTPTINNDGTVTVLMQPELSQQGQGVGGIPSTSTQTLETIANVKDGDTIALGGLKTKTISRSGDRIPLLGDLPLIGGLFRNRIASDIETDLIIFVTVRILRRADDDSDVPGT